MKKECNVSNPRWIAAGSTLISGFFIHLFGLVTILHNYDSIVMNPVGYGTGIVSGRWFLTILGDWIQKIMGGYNLSWFNGVIGLFFLAAAMWMLIDLFDIRSRKFAALLGAGFAAFPSVAACMLFKYTVTYYMFAVLMAVLAAYVAIRARKKTWLPAALAAAILIACSLGIYQAYLPLTAAIMVLYLIQQAVAGRKCWKKLLLRGIYLVSCLGLGLVLYFVFLNKALDYYQVELVSYQGMDSMGQLGIAEIIRLSIEAFQGFFLMPQENTYVLAPMPIMMWIYHGWNISAAVMIILSLVRHKSGGIHWILTAVLCGCFPIAVNLLVVMCPNSWIYTLMVHSFVMLLFVPVVLFEALPDAVGTWQTVKRIGAGAIALSLGCTVFVYSYVANITYTSEYYANRQMENLSSALVTQVRMTEGYCPDQPWAIIGSYSDPTYVDLWDDVPVYESQAGMQRLFNAYSRNDWMKNYLGVQVTMAGTETTEKLAKMDVVQKMPCWPAYGSVRVVDDVVVIKMSD